MPMIELEKENQLCSTELEFGQPQCQPANVWISEDKKEVIVTGGNITFHAGSDFLTGFITEKSDIDCALKAFERGFQGYHKKSK